MTLSQQVEVISALGSSQGTVAVVAALLSVFAYTVLASSLSYNQGLQCNTDGSSDPCSTYLFYIYALFISSSVIVVSGNLFVAIVLAISEQQSKIAVGISISKESSAYDIQLEKWWRRFGPVRNYTLYVFFLIAPLTFVSLATNIYLKVIIEAPTYVDVLMSHRGLSIFTAALVVIFGLATYLTVTYMNFLFRAEVLMIRGILSTPVIVSTSSTNEMASGRPILSPELTHASAAEINHLEINLNSSFNKGTPN